MSFALHRHEFNGVKIFLLLPSGIIFEFHGVNFLNSRTELRKCNPPSGGKRLPRRGFRYERAFMTVKDGAVTIKLCMATIPLF
jgi:hypothetical protein